MNKLIIVRTPEYLTEHFGIDYTYYPAKDRIYCELLTTEFIRLARDLPKKCIDLDTCGDYNKPYSNCHQCGIKILERKIKDGDKDTKDIHSLYINTEENKFYVWNHEHRHRAHAKRNLGHQYIPVIIFITRGTTEEDKLRVVSDINNRCVTTQNVVYDEVCEECKCKPCRINCDKLQSSNDKNVIGGKK